MLMAATPHQDIAKQDASRRLDSIMTLATAANASMGNITQTELLLAPHVYNLSISNSEAQIDIVHL